MSRLLGGSATLRQCRTLNSNRNSAHNSLLLVRRWLLVFFHVASSFQGSWAEPFPPFPPESTSSKGITLEPSRSMQWRSCGYVCCFLVVVWIDWILDWWLTWIDMEIHGWSGICLLRQCRRQTRQCHEQQSVPNKIAASLDLWLSIFIGFSHQFSYFSFTTLSCTLLPNSISW